MNTSIKNKCNINTTIIVPGDKSISHRSVMLGSLAKGTTHISGFLNGADCLSTIDCFKKMGVNVEIDGTNVTIYGKGLHGLTSPKETLDVGNSGTTLRLITGILSAQNFSCNITGDSSIQKRPMDRVEKPLRLMGAEIKGNTDRILAPLEIIGKKLSAIEYTLPVASAQVKSAIILAGLYADGETIIIEPEPTRDHTEIMLNYLGADIKRVNDRIICKPIEELYAKDIIVPGDISSAAYFMVAAAICKNSEIIVKNVGLNDTRTGIITAMEAMGANMEILNEHVVCGEKVGDIRICTSNLKGTIIGGKDIPRLIDEIPAIAVAACFADGQTIIKDAQELKVKESNRIKTVVCELTKMGANITETEDGMIITGVKKLKGAKIDSYNDHRIAMSMAIAGLCSDGETVIENSECVDISFPGFFELIRNL